MQTEQSTQAAASRTDTFIYIACILLSIVWTLLCGKDMNWDQLNYHFYSAYDLLDGRLHKDFMAASIQGYLNPLAYVPFYLMVMHNWHSILIASVLACAHSLNLILIYRICITSIAPNHAGARTTAALGTALAFLSPVYLLEVGTSFIDITTALPVLLGLLLILRCRHLHTGRTWSHPALLAGICLGGATGLKLTNVIYGPACAIALFFLVPDQKTFWKHTLLLTAGTLFGILVTYGYWGWALWLEFRNPFFPYFNKIFHSQDFFPTSFKHQRFLPLGLIDYLTLPFRMILLRRWVYLETFVPDLRFAALFVASGAAIFFFCLHKIRTNLQKRLSSETKAMFAYLFSAYLLWVWSSGNGRYGIVISLLCGPAITQIIFHLNQAKPRIAAALLCTLISAQCIHVAQGEMRWSNEPWTHQWFDVKSPGNLSSEPALYLSIGNQSNSYVFPFLAHSSSFSNPVGQVTMKFNSPGGTRLRALMNTHTGRIKLISTLPVDRDPLAAKRLVLATMNTEVAHLGLKTTADHCSILLTAGDNGANSSFPLSIQNSPRQLLICDALERVLPLNEAEERLQIERQFETVKNWCPELFGASLSVVEKLPDRWSQYFVETDITLMMYHHQFVASIPLDNRSLNLGHQSDWLAGTSKASCKQALATLRGH